MWQLSKISLLKHDFLYILIFLSLAEPLFAQSSLNDPLSLDECIEIGLQKNPGFQSSHFLTEVTKAKIEEAFSGYYPRVSFNSGADAYSKNNGSQRYDNLSAGVSLSYDIFQGYRLKSSYGASQDNYQAHLYQHETNKQSLIFNIIRAYYRTLQSERILKSAEEAVKGSSLHLEFAMAMQIAGMVTRSDILKSEVELSNAELSKIKAENNLLLAIGNLNQLLGLPSDFQIQLVDDLSSGNEFVPQSFESLLNQALNSRSEVMKFKSQLDAQNKYIQVAKGGYYPSISTSANYNYAGTGISSMQQNWWAGITLSVPVFKGFLNNARVNQEEFAYKSLKADFEFLKQQISQEVWNALLSVNEVTEIISTSSKAVESARENLSIAEGEYREGVGSIIQLTDAQTSFVTIEQNYIQALADLKISYAELEKTIGITNY